MRPLLITADTGAGYNLIRKDNLPEDLQKFLVAALELSELGDANGNLIDIEAVVHLSVRLGNTIYRVPFLIAEQLAVAALLGTSFLNKHVDHICRRSQEIDPTRDAPSRFCRHTEVTKRNRIPQKANRQSRREGLERRKCRKRTPSG